MPTTCQLAIAGPALLDLARRAGPNHAAGCGALLELVKATDRLRTELRHELAHARLSHTGFSILALVLSSGSTPIGTGGIADKIGLSPQTVSAALARLEIAGLVTLARQPANRRRITISLTTTGSATIHAALERIEAVIHRLMHVLPPAELNHLQQVCSRLAIAPSTDHS